MTQVTEKAYRHHQISKLDDMGIGEIPEAYEMPIEQLVIMVGELTIAQENGNLNLETNDGIETLKEIVDRYI